jgi:hypothetical protein
MKVPLLIFEHSCHHKRKRWILCHPEEPFDFAQDKLRDEGCLRCSIRQDHCEDCSLFLA